MPYAFSSAKSENKSKRAENVLSRSWGKRGGTTMYTYVCEYKNNKRKEKRHPVILIGKQRSGESRFKASLGK
jgi:hypothetical protein